MKKNILILAPHPDDAEFACGASIAKFIEEGANVKYAVFSPCIKSLPKGFENDVLYNELCNAAKILGVNKDNITFFNFPVREFPNFRQDILEELIKIKKNYQPDLVLMPNSQDVHQDHNTIFEEGRRAFKTSSMLGYELTWNNFSFDNDFYITVNEQHINKKIQAIAQYKSQSFRSYSSDDIFKNLAELRGLQVNAKFAECYELIRWIM